jgi:hypothetical protein
MKKHAAVLILSLLGVVLVTGAGLAGSSVDFGIPWDVVAGGGNRMASANYAIESTVSQTSIGPSSSTSFQMEAGYWYGIEAALPGYDLFLPIVMRLS